MNKKLVFGLGTGRSGSYSLAYLLDAQEGADVTHEYHFCPWEYDDFSMKITVQTMLARKAEIVGDVALYLLPYVEKILERYPDTKFVCLKRDKPGVVGSWLKHSGKVNFWTEKESEFWAEGDLDRTISYIFPKYNLPKKEALEQYWDDYYSQCEALQKKYPDNVKMWDMEHILNDKEGQAEVLEFVGIDPKKRIYQDFHANKTGEYLIEIRPMDYKSGKCSICDKPDSAQWYIMNKSLGQTHYACNECKEKNTK